MKQGMSALISLIITGAVVHGMYVGKVSSTEGGASLIAVLAYWAEPPVQSSRRYRSSEPETEENHRGE